MRLCKRILGTASLVLIILILAGGTVFAAYSYYATVQVQETGGDSYSYLPVIVDIDNDYLADNGYMSLTGLDTRMLSGSTELEHLIADDKILFIAPSVGVGSTSNYRYTLGNPMLDDFPMIVGNGGYITIADSDTLDGGVGGMNNFSLDMMGYLHVDTVPTVAAITGGNHAVNDTSHTVNLPSGIDPNDLLLVFFGSDGGDAVTFPAGWTSLFDVVDAANIRFVACYRIADGTESSTITVTTAAAQMTAHTSYRIINYTGVPESATAAPGSSANPDSPNLTPSWGLNNNLWLTVECNDSDEVVTDYPANYTNGRNDSASNAADGVGVGTARRLLAAASENPGIFTLNGAEQWIAGTVAIRGSCSLVRKDAAFITYVSTSGAITATIVNAGNPTATVTGLTSGIRRIVAEADGVNTLTLSVYDDDNNHLGNSPQTALLGGAVVPDNPNSWYLMSNATPYWDYYEHTVAGTLIAWYQPISMIIGTNLDDRKGTDAGETGTAEEDGTIFWGSNPTGIDITIGSLVSSSQPAVSPASEEAAPDIVPEGNVPVSGGVVDTAKLEDNPLYPIVQVINEYTDYTEEQIWFFGATFIILLGMGIAVAKVPNHLLLAGTVGLVLAGFFMAMSIYQWWMMLIFGFMFIMSILMERKPVL